MHSTPFPLIRPAGRDGSGFRDLQGMLFRRTATAVGIALILLHYAFIFARPALLRGGSGLTLAVVLLSTLFALHMATRIPALASLVWSIGVAFAFAQTAAILGAPEAIFGLLVIPLSLTLTASGPGTLLGIAISGAAALFLSAWAYPGFLPSSTLLWLLATACLLGIPVWGGTRLMKTLVSWYEQSYRQAEHGMEEARAHRVELQQVQEDLLQNTRELARLTRRQEALIEAADGARRSKERFVATVSHELRTPLNMIIGFSEIIAQSPDVYGVTLPPMLLADVASIRRNSEHLLEMVDDVLDLARIEAGKLSLEREWLSAATLIDSAIEAVRPLFQAKGLRLEKEILASDPVLFCDGTRIREVLINLLSNAGRLTSHGSATVRLDKSDSALLFSVQDTGPGIAPDEIRRIFDPFHQAGGVAAGGSGLGLTISQEIIEMHGGRMWVESAPGAGSTFLFSLPGQEPERIRGSPHRWINPYVPYEPRMRRSMAPNLPMGSAYVVLDEQEGTLARLLKRLAPEAQVHAVQSVEEATALLERCTADLVLFNDAEFSIDAREQLIAHLPRATLAVGCHPTPLPVAQTAPILVRRLAKPIGREQLLQALAALDDTLQDILIVDDNPEVLQLFGRILTSANPPYRVLRAADGKQAIQMARRRKPDAVILDLIMPEMGGEEVLRVMGQDAELCQIPVLVVTSQSEREQTLVGQRIEIARPTPFSIQELLSLLGALSASLQQTPPAAMPPTDRPA